MEPTFIYYKNLKFDGKRKFSINFSDEYSLEGVVYNKNRDYYITSTAWYVDLTTDITKLPNYVKIKQIFDLATAILEVMLILDMVKKN